MLIASTFWQSKTTRLMIGAILSALAAWVAGQATWQQAVVTIIVALQAIFLRDTIARTQEEHLIELDDGLQALRADLSSAIEVQGQTMADALSRSIQAHEKLLRMAESVAAQSMQAAAMMIGSPNVPR